MKNEVDVSLTGERRSRVLDRYRARSAGGAAVRQPTMRESNKGQRIKIYNLQREQ